jgi:hypothetical protein
MTLVVTVNGPETIWVLTDRRISYRYLPQKEDSQKIMFLETSDAMAFLGYSGLGSTVHGTEPADWMNRVLRGRNLPLEQSLGVLAEAMKKQFPARMIEAEIPGHQVLIPAFVGDEVRLYSLDLAFAPDRKGYGFRYTRHGRLLGRLKAQRFAASGSGGVYLDKSRGDWIRSLRSVIRGYDRGQVPTLAVADHLARLNDHVHRHIESHKPVEKKSVGPNCIVAWRHRKGGIHRESQVQQNYTGTSRDAWSRSIPHISFDRDINAFVSVFLRYNPRDYPHGSSSIGADLACLPRTPDENLR